MFIWTQDGTAMLNLKKYDRIEFRNETEDFRRLHPASKDEVYVIRLERKGLSQGIAVATFNDADEAWSAFVDIGNAIEAGQSMFSLYERDPRQTKAPQERGR